MPGPSVDPNFHEVIASTTSASKLGLPEVDTATAPLSTAPSGRMCKRTTMPSRIDGSEPRALLYTFARPALLSANTFSSKLGSRAGAPVTSLWMRSELLLATSTIGVDMTGDEIAAGGDDGCDWPR